MKRITILAAAMLALTGLYAEGKMQKNMERNVINPWKWQDERHYVQAVEVKNAESTLYISGQTAIDENGLSSTADFTSQLHLAISNLEEVIAEAGYLNSDITRITIYTTDFHELGKNFGVIEEWITMSNMKIAVTAMEVSKLFETTVVELEAIAAK